MRASGKKKWGAFVSRSNQALSGLRMIQLVLFSLLATGLVLTLPTTTWGLGLGAAVDATCGSEGHIAKGDIDHLTFIRVAWCYYAVVYVISLTWGLLYLSNHSVVAAPLALLKAPSRYASWALALSPVPTPDTWLGVAMLMESLRMVHSAR